MNLIALDSRVRGNDENNMAETLAEGAAAILAAGEPAEKVALSRALATRWRAGGMTIGNAIPPPRPARPARPALCPPRDMPRRRNFGSIAGRIALIHALAHIELNAIDLAWDIIARFPGADLPRGFYDDWVGVAAEEAEHFTLLVDRLGALGAAYGELPAHDGLWEAAAATAHDLLARLAVVPLVLEARGLDVTPEMTLRLERAGDEASAAILRRIYDDEIGHVAVGARWFERLCRQHGLDPEAVFRDKVRRHFNGALKPPFNRTARDAAGLPQQWYEMLSAQPD
jgi:uncharacterized ferritin-like protein (DUF455 family)